MKLSKKAALAIGKSLARSIHHCGSDTVSRVAIINAKEALVSEITDIETRWALEDAYRVTLDTLEFLGEVMSITSTNLNSDTVYEFDDATTPLWAVCYAYCADNDQLHELFVSAHNNTFLEFSKTLPVTVGQCSIACGDWAAPTSTTNVHPRPHTASVPVKRT